MLSFPFLRQMSGAPASAEDVLESGLGAQDGCSQPVPKGNLWQVCPLTRAWQIGLAGQGGICRQGQASFVAAGRQANARKARIQGGGKICPDCQCIEQGTSAGVN